jgi:choline dehydrogenase-like flavoprotein
MTELWQNEKFDAIVVGSGPGGATVAKELSRRKKKVLILEWGSNAPARGSLLQTIGVGLIPGKSLLFTNQMLSLVRGITTGGSTFLYYATCFDPPHEMLRRHGIDIREEIDEAKQEIPVAPLSDDLIGPSAKAIMRSAQDLGLSWGKLPKMIYQDKCRPKCDKCTYGCPYGAKWTARNYVEEAVVDGAILVNRAKVKRVILEGRAAIGVEFHRKGRRVRAFSPRVIVAAGGIGSPLILRASGIRRAGYDFFFDPLVVVMGTVPNVAGGREIPMATGLHLPDEGYVLTDLAWPKEVYAGFVAEKLRFDKWISHRSTLPIMVKVRDQLSGRLTDRGWVIKPLLKEDKRKLNRGSELAERVLKNAGSGPVFRTWYIATHPGGTVKINDVVDSNLESEYEGLYVCDCSVIPEAWGLPPTLTIVALGKRLARHIVGKEEPD